MAKFDLTTLAALAGGYFFIDKGGKNTLPTGLQKLYNELLGTPTITAPPPGGSGPSGGSTPPSASDIATWAAGVGVPVCIGNAFVKYSMTQPNGPFLPQSISQLDSWGNQTGRRHPDGSWSCLQGD